MNVWLWIGLIGICCAVAAFVTGFVVMHTTIKKEQKERELKIEEELRVNAEKEIADEIARKRAAVEYWMDKISAKYPLYICPSLKSVFDEEPFCEVAYRQFYGWGGPYHISHYNYMGNRYELFISFKATDGWIYALTIQKVCCTYVVDILPLGNEHTDFSSTEEPSWHTPHIELPEYMMDTPVDCMKWRIKENFEYFEPYDFKIAQEIEEDEESPSLSFNEMMTKMADGINAFAKTLKGEDTDGTE